jgi:hypothetical protein
MQQQLLLQKKKDTRKSSCKYGDKTEYEINLYPAPLHPNCNTYIVVVTVWNKLKLQQKRYLLLQVDSFASPASNTYRERKIGWFLPAAVFSHPFGMAPCKTAPEGARGAVPNRP